ncbi:hypothetical protein [Metakosakonia massiliensis]|uniref:Uncharacterized protein n=1 Tax=Phytobacter massiliensis TaxID=1485952 RepID=A0A6N3H6L3_9ENTR
MGGLNLYLYVENNPIRYLDPTSLKGLPGFDSHPTVLEEIAPVDDLLYGLRSGEGLPGRDGIALPRRPTAQELELLSEKHGVEFAVTYKYGPGPNGAGGQYFLHSGERIKVGFSLEKDRMLIYHTHPGGTAYASSADMKIMLRLKNIGSPQRSSKIVPSGKDVVRFDATRNKY